MSDTRKSFVDLCLEGKVLPDQIDDFVDAWHSAAGDEPLHEYLGMDESEYSLWLRDPDTLSYIVKARCEGLPLAQIVNENCKRLRTAARPDDALKAGRLERWLEEEGRFAGASYRK
jgi:hypothetical protein